MYLGTTFECLTTGKLGKVRYIITKDKLSEDDAWKFTDMDGNLFVYPFQFNKTRLYRRIKWRDEEQPKGFWVTIL